MIPAGSTKVVLAGTLTGGEIFETGFWMRGAAIASNSDASTTAINVRTSAEASNSITQAIVSLITPQSATTAITLYHYTGGTTAAFIGTCDWNHVGVGTGNLPNQACFVASLRTASSGRQNRGRMFLPGNGVVLNGDLQRTPTTTNATATDVAEFFTLLKAQFPVPLIPVVVSQTGGHSTDITNVIVNSLPDIQRRRANSMVSTTVADQPVT